MATQWQPYGLTFLRTTTTDYLIINYCLVTNILYSKWLFQNKQLSLQVIILKSIKHVMKGHVFEMIKDRSTWDVEVDCILKNL